MKTQQIKTAENPWLAYIEDDIDLHISVFGEMLFRSIQASDSMDADEKEMYNCLQVQFNFLLEMKVQQAG